LIASFNGLNDPWKGGGEEEGKRAFSGKTGVVISFIESRR